MPLEQYIRTNVGIEIANEAIRAGWELSDEHSVTLELRPLSWYLT